MPNLPRGRRILSVLVTVVLAGIFPAPTAATATSSTADVAATQAPLLANAATADRRRWATPVRPGVVIRRFDPPDQPWLRGHRGIDLRTRPDAKVRAAGDGQVRFAGRVAGRPVVVIGHGALRTTYEPVAATVRVGQRLGRGQVIGTVATGTGHCGRGHCLHLGLRRGHEYLDPRLLLGGRAILRPW